jgi:hypothetical protein
VIRVCPNPDEWYRVYRELNQFSLVNECYPRTPPSPLILQGWVYSNDITKYKQWLRTKLWAFRNKCFELVVLEDHAFYKVFEMSTHAIGPLYDPMYLPWDYQSKICPSASLISELIERLRLNWESAAGSFLARVTKPLEFTGAKKRNLACGYSQGPSPPWGEWDRLSSETEKRRAFTRLRTTVNELISPHTVDHITFVNLSVIFKDKQDDNLR